MAIPPGTTNIASHGKYSLPQQDSCPVPDAVAAQANVVPKAGLRRTDRAPMPRRLSPTLHAVDARVDHRLSGPAFSDDLDRKTPAQEPPQPVKTSFPVVMSLHTD